MRLIDEQTTGAQGTRRGQNEEVAMETLRAMGPTLVHEPTPVELDGRWGDRYWVYHPFPFTGHPEVDERLSGYPVAVFRPVGRLPERTPVVVALQGMAAPYQWNAFIVPTLLDMGLACVLFDVPLAGERSLVRNFSGNIVSEVVPLVRRRVRVGVQVVPRLMEGVACDFRTVLALVRERYGLCDDRVALFGVSLGALLSSFAFMRDGIGERLLCAIGHSDLRLFARSYAPPLTALLASPPARLAGRIARLFGARVLAAGLEFLTVLRALYRGGSYATEANPMSYAGRVGPGRRVRFLVGEKDRVVPPRDALAVAQRLSEGECYTVPGLGHGGDGFVQHVRYYLGTQLGDWR